MFYDPENKYEANKTNLLESELGDVPRSTPR